MRILTSRPPIKKGAGSPRKETPERTVNEARRIAEDTLRKRLKDEVRKQTGGLTREQNRAANRIAERSIESFLLDPEGAGGLVPVEDMMNPEEFDFSREIKEAVKGKAGKKPLSKQRFSKERLESGTAGYDGVNKAIVKKGAFGEDEKGYMLSEKGMLKEAKKDAAKYKANKKERKPRKR